MATAAGNFNIPPQAYFNPKEKIGTNGYHDKSYANTVLYVMGNNAVDIYQSFKLSSKGNTYTNVKQKLKEHFKSKVALVFKRTQFVRRLHQEKEGVLSFNPFPSKRFPIDE